MNYENLKVLHVYFVTKIDRAADTILMKLRLEKAKFTVSRAVL